MKIARSALVALLATVTALLGATVVASPASALPANFKVTTKNPSVADLGNIVKFLVETPASDEAKAANVEGGMNAVVVPRTVYNLGLFRAPRGWNKVSGPLARKSPTRVQVHLTSASVGRPTINMPIDFVYQGNWKLAASSMCQGVKTVGLPIYCNR
ncbi:hypothetical protein GOARA_044_00080 [Gordonia araii NBRC 100433]|uniref:Low molecular weight antigen MTB12-like C-terminal domain-containing protein n=1 Tax=Gordonia araii NBRC 100433 TaxID=1073574 RepID=G7H1A9_9ACTN|nr:hypothetical protein [Gordonia araii]NNG97605.1 hypothetical protein [Gordonia araii NBRC 100433]GAB09634.1 hypothetical protein GOARA_044_00080 [Gordonia araii NBRC 100433]